MNLTIAGSQLPGASLRHCGSRPRPERPGERPARSAHDRPDSATADHRADRPPDAEGRIARPEPSRIK